MVDFYSLFILVIIVNVYELISMIKDDIVQIVIDRYNVMTEDTIELLNNVLYYTIN